MSIERRRVSRNRILQGAIEILDDGVYGDLTVDALARALHMSKSTLDKYFASKDDVVVALVDDACEETEKALDALDLDRDDAPTALRTLAGVIADHADRVPRAAVLQQARLPTACQDRLQLTRASLGIAMTRVLQRGSRDGAFTWDDPVLAATTFMAGTDAAMKASARGEVAIGRGAAVLALLDLYRGGLVAGRRTAA